jgi:hypothetical protein
MMKRLRALRVFRKAQARPSSAREPSRTLSRPPGADNQVVVDFTGGLLFITLDDPILGVLNDTNPAILGGWDSTDGWTPPPPPPPTSPIHLAAAIGVQGQSQALLTQVSGVALSGAIGVTAGRSGTLSVLRRLAGAIGVTARTNSNLTAGGSTSIYLAGAVGVSARANGTLTVVPGGPGGPPGGGDPLPPPGG